MKTLQILLLTAFSSAVLGKPVGVAPTPDSPPELQIWTNSQCDGPTVKERIANVNECIDIPADAKAIKILAEDRPVGLGLLLFTKPGCNKDDNFDNYNFEQYNDPDKSGPLCAPLSAMVGKENLLGDGVVVKTISSMQWQVPPVWAENGNSPIPSQA